MVLAVTTGFALGAGVAFGSIVVAVARRAGEVTRAVVVPALGDARAGISRTVVHRDRSPRRSALPPDDHDDAR